MLLLCVQNTQEKNLHPRFEPDSLRDYSKEKKDTF